MGCIQIRFLPSNPRKFNKLYITLVSASGLPGRQWPSLHLRRMKVYAEVSLITGDSTTASTVRTDDVKIDEGSTWNLQNLEAEHTLTPHEASQFIVVKLFRKRGVGPTGYIGLVRLCVKTLMNKWNESRDGKEKLSCDVEGPTGTPNGKLEIAYRFEETTPT